MVIPFRDPTDDGEGLSQASERAVIAKLLVSLAADHGKTVIMSSHDPTAVGYFPAVHSMRDGAFIAA